MLLGVGTREAIIAAPYTWSRMPASKGALS